MPFFEMFGIFFFVLSFVSYFISQKFKKRKQRLRKLIFPKIKEQEAHFCMIMFRFISLVSFTLSLLFIGLDYILYVVIADAHLAYLLPGIICIFLFIKIIENSPKFKRQVVDRC